MLNRLLNLAAALLLACASTGVHGYARPLQPETAHRGFATAAQGAHRDQANVTPEAASENSPAIAEASDGRRFYAKARYYGAGRGSFISVDPWDGDTTSPVSLNKYLYGYANPGIYVDPDGRITLLVDLQRWFDQQSANSLAVARNFNAAQADAPLYARPGLAVGWTIGGIGYLTGAAASGVVGGANAGANAVVVAADEAGGALGSENVFTPLAGEARSEIGVFVEQTGPAAIALQADPVGVGAAATAGLVTSYADQINRAAAGDVQAQFDLAGEFTPRRFVQNMEESVLRAADDVRPPNREVFTGAESPDGRAALREADTSPVAASEVVYQHRNADGQINYYGITCDAPGRACKHRNDPEKTGSTMEVITGPQMHGSARTVEAKLIRQRLAQARDEGLIDGTEPIQEQLAKAGLLNKNRGRDPARWEAVDPADVVVEPHEAFDIRTPVREGGD